MTEAPFLERWAQQVRTHPKLKNFHVPGVMRSYPLFAMEGAQKQTRYFYYFGDQVGLDTLHLEAPGLCILMNYEDGALIEAKEPDAFGIESFKPTTYRVSEEREPAIRAALERLRPLYDTLAARFPGEAAGTEGRTFWDAFVTIVPPPLLPAYRALAPEFVAWCAAAE